MWDHHDEIHSVLLVGRLMNDLPPDRSCIVSTPRAQTSAAKKRYKILNPERMRDTYGKMIYFLQDAVPISAQTAPTRWRHASFIHEKPT